jgi:16S rRNA (adenine1518-N6/adenine1519-N6)-dimethyltransferase
MLTVGEIKRILKQEHIAISRRRGQNFLVDEAIGERIIQAMELKPTDQILEIGPGFGALTEELPGRTSSVFAIEKDKGLARVLQKIMSRYNNLQIICEDILTTDIKRLAEKKIKVVGNLPYYITTPIIGHLLDNGRSVISEIFITVQEEVGRRMRAQPGNRDYSALSIFVQYFTEPAVVFAIPKRAFYPQPRVNSSFLHLHMLGEPRLKVNSQEQFFKIVRRAFSQRRKTILNSLARKLEKGEIEQALTEAGIEAWRRPETLSIAEFARIEDIFNKRGICFD